jgi:hypothetical protein
MKNTMCKKSCQLPLILPIDRNLGLSSWLALPSNNRGQTGIYSIDSVVTV